MRTFLFRTSLLLPVLFVLIATSASQAQDMDTFYQDVDAFLGTHVSDGLVDYAAIHNEPAELDALLSFIERMDRSRLTEQEEKAFLINAYNVLVIKNVIDHYPINSPLEVNGFFDRDKFRVAGNTQTLDELEKRDLYIKYPDARLHFVLVCAALGCPQLIGQAYRDDTLETQLDTQTRAALNSPIHVKQAASGKDVDISELFSWYTDDFTRDGQTVIGFINTYRTETLPADAKLGYITYNWQLNDVKKKP